VFASSSICVRKGLILPRAAAAAIASPALFEAELRMEGGYKSTRIVRDHDGNIEAVLITGSEAGAHDLTVSYFPGRGQCEVARQILVKDGALANPNDSADPRRDDLTAQMPQRSAPPVSATMPA
jgi:hypothetical protein